MKPPQKMTSQAMKEAEAHAKAVVAQKAEEVCGLVGKLRVLDTRPLPAGRTIAVRVAEKSGGTRRYVIATNVAAMDPEQRSHPATTPHYGVIAKVCELSAWAALERDQHNTLRAVYPNGSHDLEGAVLHNVAERAEKSPALKKKFADFTTSVALAAYKCAHSGEPMKLQADSRRAVAERNAAKWLREAIEAGVPYDDLVTALDEAVCRITTQS